ncbi:hypothetical protein B0H67DRAFT_258861 [Lasiosphaeris hirsuta]|uniref:Uncharacterized protein n=1 Tax=Lasiosphaeris hirsuta TaxID=260670 RepID=A0AA40AI17_9PEZI|nr:hypothetical protein B0H67DRAFT_258861 [Lasiosphaeris hirsuta]
MNGRSPNGKHPFRGGISLPHLLHLRTQQATPDYSKIWRITLMSWYFRPCLWLSLVSNVGRSRRSRPRRREMFPVPDLPPIDFGIGTDSHSVSYNNTQRTSSTSQISKWCGSGIHIREISLAKGKTSCSGRGHLLDHREIVETSSRTAAVNTEKANITTCKLMLSNGDTKVPVFGGSKPVMVVGGGYDSSPSEEARLGCGADGYPDSKVCCGCELDFQVSLL